MKIQTDTPPIFPAFGSRWPPMESVPTQWWPVIQAAREIQLKNGGTERPCPVLRPQGFGTE
jgi:hypothetical protein